MRLSAKRSGQVPLEVINIGKTGVGVDILRVVQGLVQMAQQRIGSIRQSLKVGVIIE